MTRTPRIPGKEVVRTLEKAGFIIKRQSGSHVIMRHATDLERRGGIWEKDLMMPGWIHYF